MTFKHFSLIIIYSYASFACHGQEEKNRVNDEASIGLSVSQTSILRNARVIIEGNCSDDLLFSGTIVSYLKCGRNENREVSERYVNGFRQGRFAVTQGNVKHVASFKEGLLQGKVYYLVEGKLRYFVSFDEGAPTGEFSAWYSDGSIRSLQRVDEDGFCQTWEWYRNGKTASAILERKNEQGKEVLIASWYNNGLLESQMLFKEKSASEPLVPSWTVNWDLHGKITTREQYDDRGCLVKTRRLKNNEWVDEEPARPFPLNCTNPDSPKVELPNASIPSPLFCTREKSENKVENSRFLSCEKDFRVWSIVDRSMGVELDTFLGDLIDNPTSTKKAQRLIRQQEGTK